MSDHDEVNDRAASALLDRFPLVELGTIPGSYIAAVMDRLPSAAIAASSQSSTVDVPDIGRVRLAFAVRRQARKGFPPYWAIVEARLVHAARDAS